MRNSTPAESSAAIRNFQAKINVLAWMIEEKTDLTEAEVNTYCQRIRFYEACIKAHQAG